MRPVAWLALIAWLSVVAHGQGSGTAVDALMEMFFAKDTATLERHLPISFVRNPDCDKQDREGLRQFLLAKSLLDEGGSVTLNPGGLPSITAKRPPSSETLNASITNQEYVPEGVRITVELKIMDGRSGERTEVFSFTFQAEEGEWRLSTVTIPERDGFRIYELSKVLRCQPAKEKNERSAVGAMRTINVAQVTYASTYESVGFAESLAALGLPAENISPDSGRAGLIDSTLGCQASTCVKSGYRFRIETAAQLPRLHYKAVARPVKYGDTGLLSFYTDESGVIRSTAEDREATENDPPL